MDLTHYINDETFQLVIKSALKQMHQTNFQTFWDMTFTNFIYIASKWKTHKARKVCLHTSICHIKQTKHIFGGFNVKVNQLDLESQFLENEVGKLYLIT